MTDKFLTEFSFTPAQVRKNLQNALRDLAIAEKDEILDVKFAYAYTALLKAGIALLSSRNKKVRSVPGHHVKIIEYLAGALQDTAIEDLGNAMRQKRNIDLYAGGTDITAKECAEYLEFVVSVVGKVHSIVGGT
ncbi:MAG TPA: hypothetical protein DCZ92_02335 [Elusimicrobia bacterium]|nr:MAG: hypothetical protein A2016_00425 [Elusimicrobia bacterium GWF2_62_30]HBA59662.1 hypothetical protein [Elusimicrobiota bacterium]